MRRLQQHPTKEWPREGRRRGARLAMVESIDDLPLEPLGYGSTATVYTGPDEMVYVFVDDRYNDGARDIMVTLHREGVRHIPAIEVWGRVEGGTVYRMPKYEPIEVPWDRQDKDFPEMLAPHWTPSVNATVELLINTANALYPRAPNGKPMQWALDIQPSNVGLDPATGDLILYDVLIGFGLIAPAAFHDVPRRYNGRRARREVL